MLGELRVAFVEISVDGENNRGAAAQHVEAAEEGNESHKCLEIEAGRIGDERREGTGEIFAPLTCKHISILGR